MSRADATFFFGTNGIATFQRGFWSRLESGVPRGYWRPSLADLPALSVAPGGPIC
jgi:hypothetical protein